MSTVETIGGGGTTYTLIVRPVDVKASEGSV